MGNDKAYSSIRDSYNQDTISFVENSDNNLEWGNITTALRYNQIISNKLFANVTATYSRYRFNIGFLSLALLNFFYRIKAEQNFLLFILISITVLFTAERSAFLSILYFFTLIFFIYSKKKLIITTTVVLIIFSVNSWAIDP